MLEAYKEQMAILALLIGVLYIVVAACVIGDLISGIRKARERGELRTSRKYRRTITKARDYYTLMIGGTIVDTALMFSAVYVGHFHGWSIPIFPVLTFLIAVGECLVEVKSIFEHSGKKADLSDTAKIAAAIVAHRDEPEEIAKKVVEYINDHKDEPQEEIE